MKPARTGPERLYLPWLQRAFIEVLRRRLRSSFHAVRLAKPGMAAIDGATPLVVYCNHPSWWDLAIVPVLLQQLLPQRRVYGPIDAEALRRYAFLRRIGLYGIEPGTHAGAATFLRVGCRVLGRTDTLLCLTPQGRFVDTRARPLRLQPGLAGLVSIQPRVTLLPLALEYPFWSESTPEALARFGTPFLAGTHVPNSLDHLSQDISSRLEVTMDKLADDAQSRDPDRFHSVLDGRVGVGGVYDLWRRVRAWQAGERFDPAHVRARDREGGR